MRFPLLSVVLLSLCAQAAPPKPDELPVQLRDWTRWVLHDHPDALCPVLNGGDEHACAWPGSLELTLGDTGGRFTQRFVVYREAWLGLPGDARRWPQEVQVDGRAAVVVPSSGTAPDAPGVGLPTVQLTPGPHTVSGRFSWDALPEALAIPAQTGLLALTVRNKPIALPNRDATGRVFLQKEGGPAETENLDLTVHREVVDDIPLQLVTRLSLKVSGKSREVLLARALPDGFVPMSLQAPLPVRIEPDGRLRLQVRPGSWEITLTARSEALVTSLSRPKGEGTWPDDEVWVFDARPSLRQVLVEGVTSVDPTQTTLPDEWKRLPAFAVGKADVMKLSERRRGDSDPAPDELHLSRTFWLDFDGQGYTVSDRITGQLNRSWRLEMQPGTSLGRVVASGADQSITRLTKGALAGVELRQGRLALEADSRIDGPVRTLSAVSWDADFHSVSSVLQLPPGWRLIAARGADNVPGTWFNSWSLLDLFLVLVIALAVGRLFGVPWGVLALLTLGLSWKESDVPQYAWLAVLAGEALVRVLPKGWVRTVFVLYRFVTWATLTVMLVVFSVQHVRHGMYPALEQARSLANLSSWSEYSTENAARYQRSYGGQTNDVTLEDEKTEQSKADDLRPDGEPVPKAAPGMRGPVNAPVQQQLAGKLKQQRSFNVLDYDKNAMVQTGPGQPRWQWKAVDIRYSGPVERNQQLSLWMIGPGGNFALAFLRVGLLALLLLCLLHFPGGFWPNRLKASVKTGRPPEEPKSDAPTAAKSERSLRGAGVLVGLLLGLLPAVARAQAVPPAETLAELQKRLLEKPACAPDCASSPRMLLEATATTLRLRLEVLAGAATAVPLPGNAQHWVPETVVVDGKPTAALKRSGDGVLWLAVEAGAHQVLLEGPLPARDTVQVALPLKAHRVEAKLDGWVLAGLHEDGLADDDLQLSRRGAGEKGTGDGLETGTLPPFVQVERTLVLGLQWTVETRVARLTPNGAAVVLEVPLLKGESVTTSDIRVQDGKAMVNMPSNADEVSWSSVLEQKSPLELLAPKSVPWVEVWRLDVSPVWHVTPSGIPVIHQQDESGARMPQWRPWPGEKVTVEAVRPEGVEGQTLTIDQSRLDVTPGVRATDVTFTANMRSSRGGLHTLTLPDDAQLQSVSINGATQPIRQEGRLVAIPLVPGSQSVTLSWRQTSGIGTSWETPLLNVGAPTVNAELKVTVPLDRWVLFLRGPRMGPAVLFWSFLLVLLLLSFGLGRARVTPLKTYHWILLALGLSQVPIPAIIFVFGWLLLVGLRQRKPAWMDHWAVFNLSQLALVGVTVIALGILATSVYEGLLGRPEMQIQGNGSYAQALQWFQDRTTDAAPRGWVLSVPMLVYRGAMLLWSLWMALALLKWLKWSWQSFSTGGLWKKSPPSPPRLPPQRPGGPTTPAVPPPAAPAG